MLKSSHSPPNKTPITYPTIWVQRRWIYFAWTNYSTVSAIILDSWWFRGWNFRLNNCASWRKQSVQPPYPDWIRWKSLSIKTRYCLMVNWVDISLRGWIVLVRVIDLHRVLRIWWLWESLIRNLKRIIVVTMDRSRQLLKTVTLKSILRFYYIMTVLLSRGVGSLVTKPILNKHYNISNRHRWSQQPITPLTGYSILSISVESALNPTASQLKNPLSS